MTPLAKGLVAIASASLIMLAAGPAAEGNQDSGIVATTPILADFARQIVGDRLPVTQLIPNGADPHTFEPSLADAKAIARAKLAISNNLMLEEQRLTKTIDANRGHGIEHLRVAEAGVEHGLKLIPLVENAALDTVWLGLRVIGGTSDDAVPVRLKSVHGPGHVAAFTTGTFGQPQLFFNSADGYAHDEISLPGNAHTHLSWAFSAPGQYELRLVSPVGEATVRFAVGVDAYADSSTDSKGLSASLGHSISSGSGAPTSTVIAEGHHDFAVDLNHQTNLIVADDQRYQPEATVIQVPHRTLTEVPGDPEWRFLGKAGAETYILAQAVLGKHVHGDLDPHAWLDVKNAKAYVETITAAVIAIDPAGRDYYRQRADRYLATLTELDAEVRATINEIPTERRNLVTTHDGYGYLASAYQLRVAGFVTPNPALKPSATDLVVLHRTLADLNVPAVFLEPNQANRRDLTEAARSEQIDICEIHSDTFTESVENYVDLMRTNARSLRDCLTRSKT